VEEGLDRWQLAGRQAGLERSRIGRRAAMMRAASQQLWSAQAY
jgi:hypothetical protein